MKGKNKKTLIIIKENSSMGLKLKKKFYQNKYITWKYESE